MQDSLDKALALLERIEWFMVHTSRTCAAEQAKLQSLYAVAPEEVDVHVRKLIAQFKQQLYNELLRDL